MLSFSLMVFALQQCSSSDLTSSDQEDMTPASIMTEKRINDSTQHHTLYPDPPIKDGHDWKIPHQ